MKFSFQFTFNIAIYVLKFSLDFKNKMFQVIKMALLNDFHLLIKTDYRCCKNVADKLISDILPIIGASLECIYCDITNLL